MSLALRSGVPITALRDQLRGISSDRAVGVGPNKVLSAPDAIGQAIERYLEEQAGIQEELPIAVPAPVSGRGRRSSAGDPELPRPPRPLHGQLPGMRIGPAGLRGGVHEVPRLRLQRMRVG